MRHSELEVSNLVLWEPTQGKFNRGSQRLTHVDRLRKDTGLQTTAELKTNEGQVRVACHCPRRLDLMMMMSSS